MSENKDFDNQDFIEENDDFAEVMDDNFDASADPMAEDHIIDIDSVDEPLESFEDEWEEDFDDLDTDMMADENLAAMVQKPERNWFNIAVFGAMGIAICVMGYSYVPSLLGSGQSSGPQPQGGMAVQNQNLVVENPQQNALLAQQALGIQDNDTPSVLEQPSLLGDGVESIERPDPEAADNAVFEALGNVPEMSDGQVDDIFAAIDEMQQQQKETMVEKNAPQQLPTPSDQMPQVQAEEVFEFLPETVAEEPRAPAVETGVSELAEAVIPEVVQEEVVVQPDSVVDNVQLSALNDRIDVMMARIESLATTVESLSSDEPIFAPVTSVVDNGDVQRLEETIQNLEKKIEDLSKKKVVAAPKKRTSTKKTPAKRKAPVVKKTNWELRGASPGQAFVAEKGTQNLRTVNVGDSLNGVGRITSIAVEGGQWVVRGTSGRITQ